MHRRISHLVLAATVAAIGLLTASPASAQGSPDAPETIVFESPRVGPSGPDSGSFIGIFVLFALIAAGVGIWKFVAMRDMGIRRGMSEQDATTAALFSQDRVMSTMILKPERRRFSLRPRQPPEPSKPTIESRLAKVDSLHERGLISETEAASRRDEILDEI